MTLRYSTFARSFIAGIGSWKDCFMNGRMEIYSGAQPSSADAAVQGTLLCTITDSAGAHTAEVLSAGSVTLAGSGGSLDTLTVNSVNILGAAVPYNTSLAQTATDAVVQINRFHSTTDYVATSSGAKIIITALPGTGTSPNGLVVASTVTTMTKTDVNMGIEATGVAAVNGLKYEYPIGGGIAKLASQTWSGVNATGGTAGWYRLYGSVADAGGADSALVYRREDGAIATSGAELNINPTSFVAAATTTISSGTLTIPTL